MIKLLKKQIKYQGNNFNIKYVKKFKEKYLQEKKNSKERKKNQEDRIKENVINKWKSYCEYQYLIKRKYLDKWINQIKKQEIYQERKIIVRNSKLQEEYRNKLINRFEKCIISGMFDDVCEAEKYVVGMRVKDRFILKNLY